MVYAEHEDSLPSIRPKPTAALKVIPSLNQSQAVNFEHFRSRVVLEMAGIRSSGFWQKVVLPACYSEPAILHASIALANASQWSQAPHSGSGAGDDSLKLDTINEYNKAIQHLKKHVVLNAKPQSLRIALIACVLFIALELSIGQFEQASMHLNEGRKLLQSCTHVNISTTEYSELETRALVLASKPESTEDELVYVFADLDLQSTYFGSARPQLRLRLSAHETIYNTRPELPCPFQLPLEFHSIEKANQYLIVLTNRCLHFIGQTLEVDAHSLLNETSNLHRQHLHTSLKNWKKSYDLFCSRASVAEKFTWTWARESALILIHYTWLSVVVPTSYYEIEETDFDNFLKEFTTITDLASSVLPEEGESPRSFSLEFGVVPPLFWTVLKCRQPQIRRRALNLLGRASREGLWEPKLLIQIGRECILIEEGIENLDEPTSFRTEGLGHAEAGRGLIPLERLISIVTCHYDEEDYSTLCMTFRRKTLDGNGNFMSMEDIIRRQPYEAVHTPPYKSLRTRTSGT